MNLFSSLTSIAPSLNLFNIFTELLTIIAILSAVAVITSTNPVLAIIFLILVFINAAVYLILNGLTFIGISYIIVYIGAITVFFLFVIMMISTEIIDTVAIGAEFGKILPLIYFISVLFLYLFILFIPSFLFQNNELALLLGTFNVNEISSTAPINYLELIKNANTQSYTQPILITPTWSSEIMNTVNICFYPSEVLQLLNNKADALTINLFENQEIINTILNLFNYTNFTTPLSGVESFLLPILQIQILSEAVYGFVAFLLILTSFLLLLAMICPIILTKK